MADTPRLDAEHRRLLGLLGLAIFFEGYGRSIVSVMLRPIGQDLGVPGPELSFALAFISAGALGVLVLGHLTDRFGRRRLLLPLPPPPPRGRPPCAPRGPPPRRALPPSYRGRMVAGLAVFFLGMSYDVAGFAFTAFWPMSRDGWSPGQTSALIIVAGGVGLPGFW